MEVSEPVDWASAYKVLSRRRRRQLSAAFKKTGEKWKRVFRLLQEPSAVGDGIQDLAQFGRFDTLTSYEQKEVLHRLGASYKECLQLIHEPAPRTSMVEECMYTNSMCVLGESIAGFRQIRPMKTRLKALQPDLVAFLPRYLGDDATRELWEQCQEEGISLPFVKNKARTG